MAMMTSNKEHGPESLHIPDVATPARTIGVISSIGVPPPTTVHKAVRDPKHEAVIAGIAPRPPREHAEDCTNATSSSSGRPST